MPAHAQASHIAPSSLASHGSSSSIIAENLAVDKNQFSHVNLYKVFEPLGLLPHLTTLWTMNSEGKNIVVFSPCAAVCNAIVGAIVALSGPIGYQGDYRPYISAAESDDLLKRKMKSSSESSSPEAKGID